jgi:hypothetical protein
MNSDNIYQMALYFATRRHHHPTQPSMVADAQAAGAHILSDFDKHCETLLEADTEEGWASELRRFLCTVHWDVTKYTDLVEWWQVSQYIEFSLP